MPVILGLGILGPVLFAGLLLIALSQASSASTRPQQENPGISSAFTWATDLIGNLWHRIVRTTVSHFAAAHLVPIARWFTGLNALALGLLAVAEDGVSTARYAVERLTGHTIPQAARKASQPALAQAKAAHTSATKANAKASATSTALTHYRVHAAPKIAHATVAVDVTLPKAIGRINTDIDRVSRDQAKLKERTTSLENGAIKTFTWLRTHPLSGVTGVFAGAVAVALASLGWNIFRCRAWKSVGRKLTCGMGNWVSDLLTLIATYALATLAVLDPEALAEAAVAAVDEIEPLLESMLP